MVLNPRAASWLSHPTFKALVSTGWQRHTEEPELLLLASFPKGFTPPESCGRRRSPPAGRASSVRNSVKETWTPR